MTTAQDFGKAYARYRAKQGFSQKNPQQWAKCKNLNLHDSQIAYLEQGKLEPKSQFWLALEAFNLALANDDMPPTQSNFDKKTRDRLLDAKPFLTAEGKPAEALDFIAIFIGKAPIPQQYLSVEVSASKAAKYYKAVVDVFDDFRRQEMLTKKEAWEALLETPTMKKIPQKDYKAFQDILLGEFVPSVKDVIASADTYGILPCYSAINEWSGKESVKLKKAYTELGV